METPIKIKRILSAGEMNGGWKDTQELLDEAASAMSHNYTNDILGDVRFEGEDGKTYTLVLTAIIDEVEPDEGSEGEGAELSDEQAAELRSIVESEKK